MGTATVARTELREITAVSLLEIVAVTAYGMLSPTKTEILALSSCCIQNRTDQRLEDGLGLIVVLLGAYLVASIGWSVLVQRRMPWPFGPRQAPTEGGGWWIVLAGAAAILSTVFVNLVWPHSQIEGELVAVAGRDDILVHVISSPSADALAMVAWLAAFALGAPVGQAAERAWRARRARSVRNALPAP
jgi:hypothetical protein